jgi:hypothetical protein
MKMFILLAMFLDGDAFYSTGRVSAYSLLEPDSCPNLPDAIGMQRRLLAEIVQTKEDRMYEPCLQVTRSGVHLFSIVGTGALQYAPKG